VSKYWQQAIGVSGEGVGEDEETARHELRRWTMLPSWMRTRPQC